MEGIYTIIKRRLEDVVEAGLMATNNGILQDVTRFKGMTNDETVLPRIEILARTATPQIIGTTLTGNWFVKLEISFVSHFVDYNRNEHAEKCGAIENFIMMTDLQSELNALADDQIYIHSGLDAWTPEDGEDTIDGMKHKSTYHVQVKCSLEA